MTKLLLIDNYCNYCQVLEIKSTIILIVVENLCFALHRINKKTYTLALQLQMYLPVPDLLDMANSII